jgi:hypothetical protein
MTIEELRQCVTDFRSGLLDGRSSENMCFAVCAPLESYLACCGLSLDLVEVQFDSGNHFWLLARKDCAPMKPGDILDPTADQYGLEPVYIGPIPAQYKEWMRGWQ